MIHPPIARIHLALATLLLLAVGQSSRLDAQTVLLDFTSVHCGPCQQLKPTIKRLQDEGYPVRVVDVVQDRQLAQKFGVTRVPCLVLVANGQEQQRLQGLASYEQLRNLLHNSGVRPVKYTSSEGARGQSPDHVAPALPPNAQIPPAPSQRPGGPLATPHQPQATPPAAVAPAGYTAGAATPPAAAYTEPDAFQQRLLRSSVRIKVEDASGHSFGTGTIIDTLESDALVITCGHLFRGDAANGTITIELFEPTADGVRVVDQIRGKLESFDLKRDIGFVSFKPRTPVTVAKVASRPADRVNDPAWSVGCDRGADPTVRSSRVTAIDRYHGPPNIETSGAPVEGRSGGGLFNRQGELIGICFAADPAGDEGLYASIPSIHAELDRLNLARIYSAQASQVVPVGATERRPTPLPAFAASAPTVLRGQDPESSHTPPAAGAIGTPAPVATFPAPPAAALPASLAPTPTASAPTPDLQQLAPPERAALQEIATRAAESEIVCIIRPREPGASSEVIHLDRVSPEFLAALRGMQQGTAAR